jgi:hypothetical protein
MSQQITTAFVKQWERGITHLAEQRMSRLRDKVRFVRVANGDKAYIDQLGSVTAQPATVRHGDTPLTDTPHSRRQVTLTPYKHADLVDKADQIRVLNDPTSAYMISFGRAFGRAIDDVIIAAAFADAKTGVDGSGTAAHPGGDYQIAVGGAGILTIAQLTEALEVLNAAENDPDEGYYFACSARQIRDLMDNTTASSADYNSVKLLMTGEIDTFAGFTFVRTERLQSTATPDTRCIAWAKNSIALAIGEEPNGRISERADKNYSTQVFMSMDIGATRMNETGVVEVIADIA